VQSEPYTNLTERSCPDVVTSHFYLDGSSTQPNHPPPTGRLAHPIPTIANSSSKPGPRHRLPVDSGHPTGILRRRRPSGACAITSHRDRRAGRAGEQEGEGQVRLAAGGGQHRCKLEVQMAEVEPGVRPSTRSLQWRSVGGGKSREKETTCGDAVCLPCYRRVQQGLRTEEGAPLELRARLSAVPHRWKERLLHQRPQLLHCWLDLAEGRLDWSGEGLI
jgi:hypothetical protein